MTDNNIPPPSTHLLAYRFLVEGDLIEATDEFIGNDGQTWARPDGWEVGMEYPSRVFKSARRLVSSPSRDQATGSRPMDEASLPTTSRLSQLEARTSCAASVNVRLTSPSPQPQNNMVETKWLRFLETLQAHLGDANAAIIFELKPSVRGKALPDEQSSSHEDHSIGGKNVGLLEIVISHDSSLVVVNPVVELSHAGLQAQSRLRIVETTYKGEGCTKLDLIPQVGVADPPPETHLLRTVRTFVMAIRAEAKGKDPRRFEHCDEILSGLDSALGIIRPDGPDTSPVDTPSPEDHVAGLEAIGEITADGTLAWFNPPIRPGTKLYAAPGSTLKPEEIECVCKRAACTYDHDFGCGLDRSKERHDV